MTTSQKSGSVDILADFEQAGVLTSPDVQVARTLGRLAGEETPEALLAAALAVRAARSGSVCIDLAVQHLIQPGLPWPDPPSWQELVVSSPLVGRPGGLGATPLQWELGMLYLSRYRQQEADLTDDLSRRWSLPPLGQVGEYESAALERLFPGSMGSLGSSDSLVDPEAPNLQRLAAQVTGTHRTTFLTGGPGTGKTATIARVLALLVDRPGPIPRIALAAPTGKAAARLTEAIEQELAKIPPEDRLKLLNLRGPDGGQLAATTIHRLLGVLPDNNSRFRHHRGHHLPYDVVVIDESSMISLSLLARLVEAIDDETRLLLVGDPDQLSSVEAGAAFADLISGAQLRSSTDRSFGVMSSGGPMGSGVPMSSNGIVRLTHNWRFGTAIADLAEAVRAGEADLALELLADNAPEISIGTTALDDDAAMLGYRAAAEGVAGEALQFMSQHRVLCAHRTGPYGIQEWNRRVERGLVASGMPAPWDPWYPGRQLLVTENDYALGLFNGDSGVIVRGEDGGPVAVFGAASYQTSRLQNVETAFAMTVHRSQGSQFDRVTLILPPPESPLLSRELLYTAITRAQSGVHIVGTTESFRAAIERPAVRASGIAQRLRGA